MGRRAHLSRLALLLGTALAAALLLAACGDDDDGGDDDGAVALSKEEYLAEGDRICARGTELMAQEALERFEGEQPSRQEAEDFGQEVVVPTLTDQLGQLRDLPAPEGDQETVDQIYDGVDEGIDALESDPGVFVEPNTGGAFDDANRLAQAYGFTQCGSG
jgi:hypothetical protein